MFYKTLLVGVLLGAILMAISYMSSYSSLRKSKSPVNESQKVSGQNKPVNGLLISILAFVKFFTSALIVSLILVTAYFLFKFLGLF